MGMEEEDSWKEEKDGVNATDCECIDLIFASSLILSHSLCKANIISPILFISLLK